MGKTYTGCLILILIYGIRLMFKFLKKWRDSLNTIQSTDLFQVLNLRVQVQVQILVVQVRVQVRVLSSRVRVQVQVPVAQVRVRVQALMTSTRVLVLVTKNASRSSTSSPTGPKCPCFVTHKCEVAYGFLKSYYFKIRTCITFCITKHG